MADLSQLISHRFRGFAAHESTLEGLIAALDFGVRQIEFDIRHTLCGTPIVTHDEAAQDKDGRQHRICDLMARDLPQLGGDFAHMSTAETMFRAIAAHQNKDCLLLIDMKDAGFEDMLYALCAAHGLRDRARWVSWLPEVLFALHEIDKSAPLCLSHWCRPPAAATRAIHRVFIAEDNHIARPMRRYVHGERSGWFVNGPLQGPLKDIISTVCVPAGQLSRPLVDAYHAAGITVSAFSYLTADDIKKAEESFGHDTFFCDAKAPFEAFMAAAQT